MEYAMVGWPEDGPQLRLDYRRFSYAGKFVMSHTGKAVARETGSGWGDVGEPVAAVAFDEDRTDPETAWLRYVTVRKDRRGEGLGARLARFVTANLRERGYDRVKIAVNNPFAYHALYKAGFGYIGEQTGLAELVLVSPADRTADEYQSGLDAYRAREDLSVEEREFLAERADEDPPAVVSTPE